MVVAENTFIDKAEVKGASKKDNIVRLLTEESLIVSVNKADENKEFDKEITLNEEIIAPIVKGDILGKVTYNIYGNEYTINLIAGNNVDKRSDVIIAIIKTIGFTLLGFIILCILVLIIRGYNKARSRRKRAYRTSRYNKRFR